MTCRKAIFEIQDFKNRQNYVPLSFQNPCFSIFRQYAMFFDLQEIHVLPDWGQVGDFLRGKNTWLGDTGSMVY